MAVDALNFIGLPWPAINEDELHGWAKDIRAFAAEITQISKLNHTAVLGLKNGNQSAFVKTLAANWDRHHSEIMDLRPVLDAFADALDVVADGVLAQKIVVSGAVVALALEVIATQGEAIFTLGLAEGELPIEVALTKEAVKFALQELENQIIGYLINQVADEVSQKISQSTAKMLMGGGTAAFEAVSLTVDLDTLNSLAGTVRKNKIRTEDTSIAAKRKTNSREIETQETGGRWHVVEVLIAALKSIAEDMFAKLPGTLHTALDDLEKDLTKAVAELKQADAELADHVPEPHAEGLNAIGGAAPAAAAIPGIKLLDEAGKPPETPIYHMADDGTIRRLNPDRSTSDLTAEDKARIGLDDTSVGRPKRGERQARLKNDAEGKVNPRPKAGSEPVALGGNDLAQATQLARHADGSYGNYNKDGVFSSNNYAAARVTGANGEGDFILVGRSNGYRHSERMIGTPFLRQGAEGRIRDLYTEREPCADRANCAAWLAERMPHVQVFHSVEYGTEDASKKAGNDAMEKYLNALKQKQ